MQTAVLVVVVLAVLAQARHRGRTTSTHGEFECLDSADCGQERCCVVTPIRYSYPACRALGQQGATCRPSARPFNTSLSYPDGLVANVSDAHYIMCPCALGLHCSLGTCLESVPPHDRNSLEER